MALYIERSEIAINPDLIPKHELDSLCRSFLEAARKYFDDPENMAKFEAWKKERDSKSPCL